MPNYQGKKCEPGCVCKRHAPRLTDATLKQKQEFASKGTSAATQARRDEAQAVLASGEKLCSSCMETKALISFGNNKNTLTGLNSYCKVCITKRTKAWREANPAKYEDLNKNRADYSEKDKKRNRDAYAANPEKYKTQAKQWAENNPQRRREIDVAYQNRRRAYLNESGVRCTPGFYSFVQSLPCFVCSEKGGTADHIVPLTRGGLDEDFNVVPMCVSHNSSKQNKLMSEWKPELEEKALMTNENARIAFEGRGYHRS